MFQILVAEDDKNTRRLMEAVLKEHGYHPILACDGLEALKLLDTHHVDLVILDIMMPGMDGYEFTRQLRATDYTAHSHGHRQTAAGGQTEGIHCWNR